MTWFPVSDHPTDKATYSFTITVPQGKTAVANGLPARPPTTRDGWTTWYWAATDPQASYLATAGVGDFDLTSRRTTGGLPIIDAVDRELLALLNRRAGLALEVGEIKKREGSVVFRPEREAQVIDGLKAINTGPLKSESVAPIWREIMSASRALEAPTRVAYLGPAGTFSEEAALGFFGSSIARVPCASFDEVFRATESGTADFGVVPVENSSEGAVNRSLDLLLQTTLPICGEALPNRRRLTASPRATCRYCPPTAPRLTEKGRLTR